MRDILCPICRRNSWPVVPSQVPAGQARARQPHPNLGNSSFVLFFPCRLSQKAKTLNHTRLTPRPPPLPRSGQGGGSSAGMGAMSASISSVNWLVEDDILLKNAVEVTPACPPCTPDRIYWSSYCSSRRVNSSAQCYSWAITAKTRRIPRVLCLSEYRVVRIGPLHIRR